MKTQKQNPRGLHVRYLITKVDGTPCDKHAEYFVLRLDRHQSDSKHRAACIAALMVYADEIEDHLPKLAKDLRARYSETGEPTGKETEEALKKLLGGDGIQVMKGRRCVYYWDDCRGQGSGLDVKIRLATRRDEEINRRLETLENRRLK